ncbi:LmbE family protein [Paracidovorax avenae ATCC 19860]|uniref:LmbE family protein n=1 Tax=Paracidovorax avenae (strain ATCC 19860 / DSM 7227 / CCUG 15838 / JCM 20985 / LMG 2117 / NCPPB 1011) TaxID=643561 RepID=F0Q148_PARA1|nr:PIG-L family deacetylase [Paracidovorax avenae]ADX44053.1 LmbE family protein [Paracidovorax avenae ATCC 19860]
MVDLTADRAVERQIDIGRPRCTSQAWQEQLSRRSGACMPVSAMVGAAQRLVVLAPHPDDELLACGMLVHAHARRGGDVLIIGVTDGEASHRDVPGWSAPDTAAMRRRERVEGLDALGAGTADLLLLGLPDGALQERVGDLEQALGTLLRPDDAVVTTWCLDGHPDHEACGLAAAGAARRAGALLWEAPVWMWHWAEPEHPKVPWHRLCAFQPPAGAAAAKQAALARHRSQLSERGQGLAPVLDGAILERARWPLEYFFLPGA